MAITKERKEELVAQYVDLLSRSNAVIFAEYRGLTNAQMSAIRRTVRDANGEFHVTKLSLLKLALERAGLPVPESEMLGVPVAVGFCLDDVAALAKALTQQAKDIDLMSVRGGIMGTTNLSAKDVAALAELPPLETIRAQILGLFDAPAANLVGVIQAGVAQVVNVLHAYVDKGDGEPAAEAAAG